MSIEKRVKDLEQRLGTGDRTFHVLAMYDDDYNALSPEERARKLEAVRAKAGPDDVILKVEMDQNTTEVQNE